MPRSSPLLVSLFFCFLFIVSFFPRSTESQSTLRSLSLNGTNQYVTAASSTSLNITGAITVEGWIKLNSVGAYQAIVSREAFQQAGTGGGYRLVVTDSGKLRLDLFQSHNTYTTAIGTTTITTGVWHHVAGVFDGSQMRVYVDGVLNGSVSTTNGPASGTGGFYIGRFSYSFNPYYFGGLVDEVRVSAAALYTSNFTPGLGPGANVRGLWKFDGQTMSDSSGSGNHATAQNGAGFSTDVPAVTNNSPTVSLTHPLNNTSFAAGSNIVVSATAADTDGSVTKVDFYHGTTLLGTDTSSPYTFVWTNVPAGSYTLTAQATDDGNAAMASGALAVSVTAQSGSHSLSLNGTNQYVTAASSTSLNITGAITVEGWIKLNSVGAYQAIVSREAFQQAGTGGGYRLVVTDSGKLRLDLFQSHNTYTTAIGTTTITTGVWHHVAGVFDGSQMRVYVDGVLNGSVSTTNGPASGTGGFYIGRFSYSFNPYYFGGLIDEVRVSAAALYTSNFTPGLGPGTSVRGLWKFDGQTMSDSSGSGNHATAQSGAGFSTDVPPTGGAGSQRPMPVSGGPYSAQLAQAVSFSSSGSLDPDGTITAYHWNFGDGTSASTANPSHAYAAPGIYTATLTVTDNAGLLASATATVIISNSGSARVDPLNQSGGNGENPLSRNFNWTLPLVSLPGRAGLDLGLSLSYNSLVWTRSGNNISFDDDRGMPSPGFRLGFPVIQPLYYNSEVGKTAYLLIGSDGSRTELRQVNSSSLYEAADSSHLLLDATTMVLRTTDGTQLTYTAMTGEFNCTQIKDRNGNYITINYTTFNRIDTVTDTLGRSIRLNYDANGRLTSISQLWNQSSSSPVTHYWARFSYTDTIINTNFSTTTNGPTNNTTIKTLSRVTLADDSYYDFSYSSWGQVWRIRRFASDDHLLNYRSYNLPQTADPQVSYSDCPRFTERRDWAQYWNGDADGIPASDEEAVTLFAPPVPVTWTMPDGTQQTGTRAQVTTPDGTSNKIYFIGTAGTASGWRRGLPALVETVSNGNWQRKMVTTWTQDNTSASYPLNPRVTETNIFDPAGNRARVQTTYQQVTFTNGTSCQLPKDVYEYAANATTILRSTRTDYNSNSAFTDRRIIGLVSEKKLYQGDVNNGGVLKLKIGFFYDNENGSSSIIGTDAPVQHDNTNYTASFVTGRGNLSSVRRYNVDNLTQFTTNRSGFNTAGALVFARDALDHEAQLSYADSFSDGNNSRNTLAYPTSFKDPDGYASTVRYHYDFGAVTYKRTPQPNTTQNLPGPEQAFTFDSLGRLQQVTNVNNGAYSRFVYPNDLLRMESYATIQDGLGEAYSFTISDGAGRVIASATQHPGSVGGYTGQKFVFDSMGRRIKVSNPTETNATGAPAQWITAGDDAASPWIFTDQTFDWKSRPLLVVNQDGTTRTASYAGCGCAGGEVITLTDEGTIDAGVAKRRQQKIYADVLGRPVKTEILNWEGGNVYSTIVNTFNALDQVTQTRQYAGVEGSSTYQDTTMTFDGYGRLSSLHLPEHSAGTSTVYSYNADDTVLSVTDPRNAAVSYQYNNRHLVTGIAYNAPVGLAPTANVSFGYDAAGNRTSMTDGEGGQVYSYDQLSRLVSETRFLTDVGSFTLTYGYNLAGELKRITDASNTTINYGYDVSGRLSAVTGSDTLVGGLSTYASGFQYRASGRLKQLSIGSRTSSFSYNSRVQPTSFTISGGAAGETYEYYNDGRLSSVDNATDHNFDSALFYDHAARLKLAASGGAARDDNGPVPFFETFSYDSFNNMVGRSTETWGELFSDSASYSNSRRSGWTYDAAGRIANIDSRTYIYDASGRNTNLSGQRWTPNGYVPASTTNDFDGDGKRVREESSGPGSPLVTYYLRSSVLGGAVVAELTSTGQKQIGYVYTPAGDLLATQFVGQNYVMLRHGSPIGAAQYEFFSSNSGTGSDSRRQLDPLGANVRLNAGAGVTHADNPGDIPGGGGPMGSRTGAIENPAAGCTLDFAWVPCSFAYRLLANAAEQCPDNDCAAQGRRLVTDSGKRVPFVSLPFMAFANRESGYYLSFLGLSPQAQADLAPIIRANSAAGATIPDFAQALGYQERDAQSGLSQGERNGIQDGINRAGELTANPDCFNFINAVLQRAAYVINQRWWATNQNYTAVGGHYAGVNLVNAHNAYADQFAAGRVTALHATGRSGNMITYGQTLPNGAVTWNSEFFTATRDEKGWHTLHESLHQFNGFNDEVLANSARVVAGQNVRDFSTEADPVGAASSNLNQLIRGRCPPNN